MTPVVKFSRLHVRQMPGFPVGGPVLTDLGVDVVVVSGPNASGKTTTAKAIQALLWPGAPECERWSVLGEFDLDHEKWLVDINAGRVLVQNRGLDVSHPNQTPPDLRDRYRPGLQELTLADSSEFAEAVRREASGGYDLSTAESALGFADPKPRRGAESERYEAAQDQVRDAQRQQAEVLALENRLDGLKNDEARALDAQRRREEIKAALKWLEAGLKVEAARIRLETYPPEMERLTGRDLEDLGELKKSLEAETESRRSAELDLAEADQAKSATGLPRDGVPATILSSLKKNLDELDQAAREIMEQQKERDKARIKVQDERHRLGRGLTGELIVSIDFEGIGDLAGFARRDETARSQLEAKEALLGWLGPQEAEIEDEAALNEGLSLLNRWLSDPAPARLVGPGRKLTLVLAGAAVAAGLIFGLPSEDWRFLSAAVGGLALLLLAWLPSRKLGIRGQRQEDYARTGLAPPQEWTIEWVEAVAESLRRRLASAHLAMERRQRWAGLEDQIERLRQEAGALQEQRETLIKTLGAAPNLGGPELYALAESIRRWQAAQNDLRAAEAGLESVTGRQKFLLDRVNKALASYEYKQSANRTQAREKIEDLALRADRFRQAETRREEAVRRLEDLTGRIERLEANKKEFYSRLGLTVDDEPRLRQLYARRADYLQDQRACQDAVVEVEIAEKALAGGPKPEAADLDRLKMEIEDCEKLAAGLTEISQDIGRITQAVEQARQSHDLEAALAGLDDARARLFEVREKDRLAGAGWLLARYLEAADRDRSLPNVFHKAAQIFSKITRGRYNLDFDPAGPDFRARDTLAGIGLDLDQLSSATRLQLLLAVRLAFVEEREPGPRLPLLLDETLANSDEERARAIIEAAVEIAFQGRQVFYFTARPTETAKWQELLEQDGRLKYKVVDLAAIIAGDQAARHPLLEPAFLQPEPPSPDGLSHLEYGRVLKVPAFDPRPEEVGHAHLWHLVDDPKLLHRLLKLGLETWGQWQSLVEHGGLKLLDEDRPALEKAEAKARSLKIMARNWRHGRGRSVTRQDLIDGGVTATFIDRVHDLAEQVDGRAEPLLEALENGSVKRFQKSSCERLKEFLEEAGCLDPNPPFTREEIRLKALGHAASDIRAGHLSAEDIDELLGKLKLD